MMQRNRIKFLILLSVLFAWLVPARVSAMISFSTGNRPVENKGWPTGTEEVANLTSRVVSVSGPGMGEYYFGYRCNDTAEFNVALKKFSAIRAPRSTRRSISMDGSIDIIDDKPLLLVVHDYCEDITKRYGWTFLKGRLDWTFVVWVAEDFYRNFNRPRRAFIVEIKPKDGVGIGTWGGSIQCKKDGVFEFKGVPPGEYVVIAKPNPMREGEASEPKLVIVAVGGTVNLEITSHYAHSER